MAFFYHGVLCRNLCILQGRHVSKSFIFWVALTSWITSVAPQGLQSGCHVFLTGSGIIRSPDYPSNYPDNINCTWRLQSSSISTNIRLKFDTFNTELSYDVLRIYDQKRIVASYSGSYLPPILTLGKTALLVFTTDSSVNRTGFNASFTSVGSTDSAQCNTYDVYWCINSRQCISRFWRCDNQLDCLQGDDESGCQTTTSTTPIPPSCGGIVLGSGEIQSPNYPRYYPNNARCSWFLFSSSNGTVIRIQFNSFTLEKDYDYVTVTDDRSVSKKYTGSRSPFMILLGRNAIIAFYSDGSNSMQGFTAQFASVNVTTRNQCMASDTFWCTYEQKCISMSWRCDGYPDCTFNEDEYSCPSTTLSSTTTLSPQIDCQRYGKFWCSRSAKCVPASYRCDHYNDCTYGEDEANCSNTWQQQCQQMQRFWCATSRQCINWSWKCDHTNDCTYGEDEQGCSYLSSGAITGIATGCVCGVVLLILFVTGLIRITTIRRLRSANPRSNNYLQTRVSTTVYSTPATYASQFGAPNRQAVGPQGSGGLPLDQFAPPSYDATMKAYATGQYTYTSAQSGALHPPSSAPSAGAQPTN